MQIKKLKGELLYKDVLAVAPLKKQQMCVGADPEASQSRGPAALEALSSMELSLQGGGEQMGRDMQESGYEGRGHGVQGFQGKEKNFVLQSRQRQLLQGRGSMPTGSCATHS